jgi:hypothetical protein
VSVEGRRGGRARALTSGRFCGARVFQLFMVIFIWRLQSTPLLLETKHPKNE